MVIPYIWVLFYFSCYCIVTTFYLCLGDINEQNIYNQTKKNKSDCGHLYVVELESNVHFSIIKFVGFKPIYYTDNM